MKKLITILFISVTLFACNQKKAQYPVLSPVDSMAVPMPILGDDELIAYPGIPDKIVQSGNRRKPTPIPNPIGTGYSCIYFDFDGEPINSVMWNNGVAFTAEPAPLSAVDIKAIMVQVKLYYSQWNVVVTDSLSVYQKANQYKRTHVVVTSTSFFYPAVSGISYIGSATWGDGTVSFVFTDRLYNQVGYIQSICGHESGHSAGLFHQSDFDVATGALINTYSPNKMMGYGLGYVFPPWVVGLNSQHILQDDKQVLTNLYGPKL